MKANDLHLCFIGNMLGKHSNYSNTQGEITANLFAAEGYQITCASSKINRVFRLTDIVKTLVSGRKKFDVVLLEVYSGMNFVVTDVAGALCKFFKLPLVMVLHGGGLPEFTEKYPRWTKKALRRADVLVAPSKYLANKITVAESSIKIIPNVIEIGDYDFKLRSKIAPKLLWMRSFHELYHPEMALDVLTELKKDFPEATLTMAGADKGLETEIKRRAADLGLNDSVRFPGFLDQRQKAEEFSRADIYLHTNRVDNMPVSVVEAGAFGLPVIAARVGGVPFLIADGESGLLVESGDTAAMVGGIKRLLKDAKLVEKFSKNGRLLAEDSAWSKVKTDWERLIQNVLAGKNKMLGAGLIEENISTGKV